MNTLDLRKFGPITECNEIYLAELIANMCEYDEQKRRLSLCAKKDFGWQNGLLVVYSLANLISLLSHRVDDNISSGEWLCGIFASGDELTVEHMMILMSFVNLYTTSALLQQGQYRSGKDIWLCAPSPMKEIFDLIDTSIINNQPLSVVTPTITPVNDTDTLEMLELLPFEELHDKVKITWPMLYDGA